MKKVTILIIMSLSLAFIFIIPLTLALEPCRDRGVRGDVNGDSIISITDGVRILNYLFRNGPAPECTEAADFNEDGSINIADVIKLFNFLFKGGPGPTNYYYGGTDDPPQLGFDWVIPESELREEGYEIPEIKAQIPTTVFVGDISGEKDIKKCSVTAIELNSAKEPIGEEKLIFDSQWHLDPEFEGNDLSSEPLAFVPKQPEIMVGSTYDIAVTCTDNKDQSDTIKMLLTPIAPIAPAPIPYCASPDTCCVCVEGSGCDIDPEASPRCLGAEDTNGDLIPDKPKSCSEFGGPNDPPAYRGAWVENPAACTTQNQEEGGGGAESTIYPLTRPTGPCKIKGLTILKTGDPIPSDIPLPPEFIKMTTPQSDSQTIVKLGHNEGWTERNVKVIRYESDANLYKFGFASIVLAHLEDGSDPNSCPEVEFTQFSRIKAYLSDESTITLPTNLNPALMLPRDTLLKHISVGDNIEPTVRDDNAQMKYKSETRDLTRGCPVTLDGSGKWCYNNHLYERGAPGEKYKEWRYFFKKHKKNTIPPKILWYRNYGSTVLRSSIAGGGANTGHIFLDDLINIKFSSIAIVEDFGSQHRFYCEMRGLKFDNLRDKATKNQKVQVTEPTCKCVEQEWRGGQWEDKGAPKECGLGSKSFIQSV